MWQWLTCEFTQDYDTDLCCHCGLYMRYMFLCSDYTRDERLKSPHCARCLTDMSGQFFDGDCNRNAVAYRQQCVDNDLNCSETYHCYTTCLSCIDLYGSPLQVTLRHSNVTPRLNKLRQQIASIRTAPKIDTVLF